MQENLGQHYKQGNVEVIDLIESYNLNFCLGNAVKYIARCNYKNSKESDLKKAMWYIPRELRNLQSKNSIKIKINLKQQDQN